MKPVLKVAIVAGGYLLALLMAFAAVALHAALAGESGARASDGMSAFGDLVLFVAVFGAVALVPTGAAFFFLFLKKKKPNRCITIYISLLNEGTDVWRPVSAEQVGGDIYRVTGTLPDAAGAWKFATGDRVRCREQTFAGGERRLVAYERVTQLSPDQSPEPT